MGRHAARAAVFVDDSGRRAVLARAGMRVLIGLLVLGLGAVVVSLLGGVPLPGLTPPVALPSAEHAHPRIAGLPAPSHAAGTGAPGSATGPTLPVTLSPVATSSGAGASGNQRGSSTPTATATSLVTTPATPTPSRSVPSATPAPSASRTPGSPSRSVPPGKSGSSHGRTTTPPGHQ